jgi:hypothetical protein
MAIKPYTSNGHGNPSAVSMTLTEKICKVPVGSVKGLAGSSVKRMAGISAASNAHLCES